MNVRNMNGLNSPEELLRWAKRSDDDSLTFEQNEYAMNRFHKVAQEMGLSDDEAIARWERYLNMDRRERARATGLYGLSGLGTYHEELAPPERYEVSEDIRSSADTMLFTAEALIKQGSCVKALKSLMNATEGIGVAEAYTRFPGLPNGAHTGVDQQRDHVTKLFIQKCVRPRATKRR